PALLENVFCAPGRGKCFRALEEVWLQIGLIHLDLPVRTSDRGDGGESQEGNAGNGNEDGEDLADFRRHWYLIFRVGLISTPATRGAMRAFAQSARSSRRILIPGCPVRKIVATGRCKTKMVLNFGIADLGVGLRKIIKRGKMGCQSEKPGRSC